MKWAIEERVVKLEDVCGHRNVFRFQLVQVELVARIIDVDADQPAVGVVIQDNALCHFVAIGVGLERAQCRANQSPRSMEVMGEISSGRRYEW